MQEADISTESSRAESHLVCLVLRQQLQDPRARNGHRLPLLISHGGQCQAPSRQAAEALGLKTPEECPKLVELPWQAMPGLGQDQDQLGDL